jgi:CubicO group peptidase (beta-lactamase class C family)
MTKKWVHAVAFLMACLPSAFCSEADCGGRIDSIFKEWNKPGSPGAEVAVLQHGKLVYEKGYGLANLEYEVPVTAQTVYHVASVSKQFTAMALVLLEKDGKLSLEDDLHKYLPELPDYGHAITIRQLLQHTSGIRDQWQTLALAGWRLDDVITQEQILRVLFRQKELNFAPGTKHLYSNGGYTLAAEIVARASGKPFPAFCSERLFRPLEMDHTHFHLDHRQLVPNRAYSYGKTEDGYEALPLNYANVGATNLFTTASDLVRWLDNFRDPKVGGRTAIERLQVRGVLNNREKLDYALGIALGRYRGHKTISHGGGDAGYRSFVLWFPDEELGIAVLSGLASFDSGGTANKVADVFLADKKSPEPAKPASESSPEKPPAYIALEPKVLKQYTGRYHLDAGLDVNIMEKEGKLMAQVPGQGTEELHPLETNRFYVEPLKGVVEFIGASSAPLKLKFTHDGNTTTAERTSSAPWEPTHLEQYAGVYWSDELETEYTITCKDGKLAAQHIRHGETPLVASGPDRCTSHEWFMPEVKFQRDSSGKVSAMILGGGRVTGIRFERRSLSGAARTQ